MIIFRELAKITAWWNEWKGDVEAITVALWGYRDAAVD